MTVKMIVSSEVRDSIPLDEVLNLIKKNYVSGLIDGLAIMEDIIKKEIPTMVQERLLEALQDVDKMAVEDFIKDDGAEEC